MRLGDLDALWEYFRDLQCDITKYSRYHQLNDEDKAAYDKLDAVLERIDDAPTIDAVPVVRCSECENWREHVPGWCGEGYGYCRVCMMDTKKDHFCSYGERKEGDGDGD